MTPRHAYIRHIQEDEHKKLFRGALTQSIHVNTLLHSLEKYEKFGRLLDVLFWLFLLIHVIAMLFDQYHEFLKHHKWLYIVVAIAYLLPLPLRKLYHYLKNRPLKQYRKEIEAKEYLVTYGQINQVIAWCKEKQYLELAIHYIDLFDQPHQQQIKIPYPSNALFSNREQLSDQHYQIYTADFQPEQLVGTSIRLCLLAQSHFIFDLTIVDAPATHISLAQQERPQQNLVWYTHVEGVLCHQKPTFLCNVSQVMFIRTQERGDFYLHLQGIKQADLIIDPHFKDFERIENNLLNHFSEIDFNTYQKLKYSDAVVQEVLWQSPHPIASTHDKEILWQQFEMNLTLIFVVCLALFLILLFYIHGYALLLFIGSIILLVTHYFSQKNNPRYFIAPPFSQL